MPSPCAAAPVVTTVLIIRPRYASGVAVSATVMSPALAAAIGSPISTNSTT